VRALYRSATEILRDIYLLTSQDHARNFQGRALDTWEVNRCPMSSMSFAEAGGKVEERTMNFEELMTFVEHDMRMSHIYQPVMIRALLDRNGRASVSDIARELLTEDRSQLEYYAEITKKWLVVFLQIAKWSYTRAPCTNYRHSPS
jgi:hypothetical protein